MSDQQPKSTGTGKPLSERRTYRSSVKLTQRLNARIAALERQLAAMRGAASPGDIEAMARVCIGFQKELNAKGDTFGEKHWLGVTKRLLALAAILRKAEGR